MIDFWLIRIESSDPFPRANGSSDKKSMPGRTSSLRTNDKMNGDEK